MTWLNNKQKYINRWLIGGKNDWKKSSNVKQDLRIQKTKRAIYGALEELLLEKSINKITVTELAKRAEINKGTFYLHYKDIYDLYEDALIMYLDSVASNIPYMELFFTDIDYFAEKLVTNSLKEYIFKNNVFFSKENASFNENAMLYFCNALSEKLLEYNQIENTNENKMKLRFIFSGIGTLLRFNSDKDASQIINIMTTTARSLFPEIYDN